MVTIEIRRATYTDTSIISRITVGSDKATKSFAGYALENAHAGVLHNRMPTPHGSYRATTRKEGHLGWRIQLHGVPDHTDIEIHHGNYPRNPEGCFVVGLTKSDNFVGHGDKAMAEIRSIVESDASARITVRVYGKSQKS